MPRVLTVLPCSVPTLGCCGMFRVIRIHLGSGMIVPAAHVNHGIDALINIAFGRGVSHGAGGIEMFHLKSCMVRATLPPWTESSTAPSSLARLQMPTLA